MIHVQVTDRVQATQPRRTADGYLVAQARVARTGIQEYLGRELGVTDKEIVRVYRSPESVFATDSLASYAHRPVTSDHPPEQVTDKNWRKYARGQTGGDVVRDGEFVSVPLVLMDGETIAAFEAGKRELSMGYDAQITMTAGVTDSGEEYDAVMTDLRMNHLALVPMARGGPELRIGDGRTPNAPPIAANNPPSGGQHMTDKTRQVIVDGLTIETTEQGAQALEKLQKSLADATATADKAIAAKDAELAKLQAQLDDAQSKVLTDAQLDAKVRARADLIATAKRIADQDYSGKSDEAIRRAAVVAKLGDAAIADKSEAYVDARFDILAEAAANQPDPFRQAMTGRDAAVPAKDGDAYREFVDSIDYRTMNKEAQ